MKNLFCILAFTSILIACNKKNDDPSPSQATLSCKVTTITHKSRDFSRTINAVYNSNNQIDSVYETTKVNNDISYDVFTAVYNDKNQLVKGFPAQSTLQQSYISMHYDLNGLRDVDTFYYKRPAGYGADHIFKYSYNNKNQIIKIEDNSVFLSQPSIATFTYDASGNILNQTEDTLSFAYTYDEKKAVFDPYFYFYFPPYTSRKNNIKTFTQKETSGAVRVSSSYTSTFEYNSNDYPVSEIRTYLDNSASHPHIDSLSYSYTCK